MAPIPFVGPWQELRSHPSVYIWGLVVYSGCSLWTAFAVDSAAEDCCIRLIWNGGFGLESKSCKMTLKRSENRWINPVAACGINFGNAHNESNVK
ncbi:hypothetical protein IF2G_04218 [Cordyceps javanica]|nr:hypothetical protein IF2G_04218 [Cordyceps javanica]